MYATKQAKTDTIVLAYGKAYLAVPTTAKPRLIAWILLFAISAGTTAHLEYKVWQCNATVDSLLERMPKSKDQSPTLGLPPWANSFQPQTTEPKSDPLRLRSPLMQILEDLRARPSKAHPPKASKE